MMSPGDKFVLYVFEGDYGLPSLDTECTQIILYTKLLGVPLQLRLLDNLKNCMLYSAPRFVHKNVTFKTFNDVRLYLKTLNYDMDKELSLKEKSEALAWSIFVQAKLRVVDEYVLWMDPRNSDEFSRTWHMKALPLPFNHLRMNKLKENAMDLLDVLYPSDWTVDGIKDHLVSVATECLSSLSIRLNSARFFFGDSPSTLDVIVYSYLAPLTKLPLPSNNITGLVSMWPNLENFVKRMDAKCFPGVSSEPKYITKDKPNKNSDDDISYVAISILTFSAMSLIVGFAMNKGFITSRLI